MSCVSDADLRLLAPAGLDLASENRRAIVTLALGERILLFLSAVKLTPILLVAGLFFLAAAWFFSLLWDERRGLYNRAVVPDIVSLARSVVIYLAIFTGIVQICVGIGAAIFRLPIVVWCRAGRTPKQTATRFFRSLGDLDYFGIPAWRCLLDSAKRVFPRGRSDFIEKWSAHIRSKAHGSQGGELKSVDELGQSGDLAVVRATLKAGSATWTDVRLLARVGRRWYVVDPEPHDVAPPSLARFY